VAVYNPASVDYKSVEIMLPFSSFSVKVRDGTDLKSA
jgi:hypothetical protein